MSQDKPSDTQKSFSIAHNSSRSPLTKSMTKNALVVMAGGGVAGSLVFGLKAFMSNKGVAQNKGMQARVAFQGVAVACVIAYYLIGD